MIKKVVAIGPESTGKTTLCEQLSVHYESTWVKEYARKYLTQHSLSYTFENLLDIAKEQINQEEKGIKNLLSKNIGLNKPLFIDTNMYVFKVWSEFVFEKCHHWILNRIVERRYDLYLLCNVDLPWVKDELREYPDLKTRKKLYHHYKDILINQNVPWVEISGNNEERLESAIRIVNHFIIS